MNSEKSEAPGTVANGEADSPRIDFSKDWRASGVRPPVRPFGAKRPAPASRSNPLFSSSSTGGNTMSDKFSADRMAAFAPQINKRMADIPNLTAMRTNEADADGKRLVIGKQIRMSGEISGCERLVVEGKVEANLSEVKFIEVTANGAFKGNAEVESAVIAGTYEGNLKVRGHLEIAPSGMVKGGVAYKSIAVAHGGKVLGSIETIEG